MKKFLLRRLGVARDAATVKPSLQTCIEAVLEQSDTLVDDVLAGLEASLDPARTKARSVPQPPASQEAIQALGAQRANVRQTFAEALRVAVYGGELSRAVAPPMVRFDDFQFLEEEQIDANIEFALTQQEVALAVDDALPVLNALVSSLLG